MKAAIVVFPGSNCDRDVRVALAAAMGAEPLMVWHRETELPKADLIVLPGGFSYGDYLRAGAMAARSPVMAAVAARARQGALVLGICNGFQVLTETGLLPGVLMRNAGLNFVCRDVFLKAQGADGPFNRNYEKGAVVRMPIAHSDGNYFADAETLHAIEGEDRIAWRYSDATGAVTAEANPNGSLANIAGILNESRNVLGMMPHPERLADEALGGSDGRAMFEGLVEELA